MQIGKVTGTVTATAKAERLTGQKLLIVDVIDASGNVLLPGVGDTVLLTQGSAARMAGGLSSAPVDLTIVAIVDRIST